MTFRTKLLLISSFTIAGAVALVTGAVSVWTRRAFDRIDGDRRTALLDQFREELDARGREIAQHVEHAAASADVQQIVAGAAEYDRAHDAAEAESLDFLDVLQPDLIIISSAHWPARFGYRNDWEIAPEDWQAAGASAVAEQNNVIDSDAGSNPAQPNVETAAAKPDAFLARVPMPDGVAVALVAIRRTADGKALVVGGRRLSPQFLKSLGVAPGMRALVWFAPDDAIDAHGPVSDPGKLEPLISGSASIVQWTADRASAEAFQSMPLAHRGKLMGVLLAGTSLGEQINLERAILWIGSIVGGSGIIMGVLLGWWTTERITRPVERLAEGARAVAAGDWSAQVAVESRDEIGELAQAFNRMTEQILEQKERALQAERVAAWRELARRLAHELKNPLFPLQITIENLQRARDRSPAEFDEVFRESTHTLLDELANLKAIIGRFSDFAKMPAPQFEAVDVNEIVNSVMKLHASRFGDAIPTNGAQSSNGVNTPIIPRIELASGELKIFADRDQLRRAFSNLVLNAMDAMPSGGVLRVATAHIDNGARLSVSDSGQGLTQEECARLFTPYYTTKLHGTGLGLAIVQSVVSDHHGKISVESSPGRGATFIIDLPASQNGVSA